ncbi:MAG: DUF1311 domain-containing protein [Sphingobacteriaceae bacterium]|nr:MAG: DUF1311 domain-containing protein [Sphingobacteriaceae bacterium]
MMNTLNRSVILFYLFMLGIGISAFGQKVPVAQKVDCSKATTQVQLNECAQQQFLAADRKLNILYKQVMEKLSPLGRKALVKAQRGWIQFRDDNALVFAGQYEGGSMYSMVLLNVKTATTRSRTDELQKLLKGQ